MAMLSDSLWLMAECRSREQMIMSSPVYEHIESSLWLYFILIYKNSVTLL